MIRGAHVGTARPQKPPPVLSGHHHHHCCTIGGVDAHAHAHALLSTTLASLYY
jgi:hypothetical protein